jgi:hypothetical protein
MKSKYFGLVAAFAFLSISQASANTVYVVHDSQEPISDVFVNGTITTNDKIGVELGDVQRFGIQAIATAATPLPATLPLFATGLGALGLIGWWRGRKATAWYLPSMEIR